MKCTWVLYTKLKTFKNEVFALGGQRRTEMPKGTIWRLTHGNKMASSSTSITQEQQCCTLLSGMRKNCFHVKNATLGFFFVTFLIHFWMLTYLKK